MTEIFKVTTLLILVCAVYSVEVKSRYYPRYHFAPSHGWMNDPNGFVVFQDEFHLFYQHNPETSQEPGTIHWGHAKSKDLFHWEHLPIALDPDEWYDKNGVFSGSAIVENDTLYLIYTGNINHPGNEPDHEQHQILAFGKDGVNFTKYENNPVINGTDRQPNFRDPKIWKHGDQYYTVIGNEDNGLGRVLLYTSKDLMHWEEAAIVDQSHGDLGFMWECPDFFELDGRFVLLFSPQGIEPQGDKYRNLYQTGYIVGDFDYATNTFTPKTKFVELDNGHDFYATQTLKTDDGRRILIAWMDMWENVYPERNDGFTGIMTVPRELKLDKDGRLLQRPVRELREARGKQLYDKPLVSEQLNITLEDKTGDIRILSRRDRNLSISLRSNNDELVRISYNHLSGKVSLVRGDENDARVTDWKPKFKVEWHILIDASSVELFCGEGEVTFSSRFFPDGDVILSIDNSDSSYVTVKANSMLRTLPTPLN